MATTTSEGITLERICIYCSSTGAPEVYGLGDREVPAVIEGLRYRPDSTPEVSGLRFWETSLEIGARASLGQIAP